MDAQKWQAFLSDPELKDYLYQEPDGNYLFRKILHDVLHCLNMSDVWFDILAHESPEIAQSNAQWLSSKRLAIQSFIPDVNAFWQYDKNLPVESGEWPYLIEQVGMKLETVHDLVKDFKTEAEQLDITTNDFISRILGQLQALKAIVIDVQTEEYTRLWTILRYQLL